MTALALLCRDATVVVGSTSGADELDRLPPPPLERAASARRDTVTTGMPLLTLHTDDEPRFTTAMQALEGAIAIGPAGSSVSRLPLIIERIT